jgi:hypothetical protein
MHKRPKLSELPSYKDNIRAVVEEQMRKNTMNNLLLPLNDESLSSIDDENSVMHNYTTAPAQRTDRNLAEGTGNDGSDAVITEEMRAQGGTFSSTVIPTVDVYRYNHEGGGSSSRFAPTVSAAENDVPRTAITTAPESVIDNANTVTIVNSPHTDPEDESIAIVKTGLVSLLNTLFDNVSEELTAINNVQHRLSDRVENTIYTALEIKKTNDDRMSHLISVQEFKLRKLMDIQMYSSSPSSSHDPK